MTRHWVSGQVSVTLLYRPLSEIRLSVVRDSALSEKSLSIEVFEVSEEPIRVATLNEEIRRDAPELSVRNLGAGNFLLRGTVCGQLAVSLPDLHSLGQQRRPQEA